MNLSEKMKDPSFRADMMKELRRELVSDHARSQALTDYLAHFARLQAMAKRAQVTGVVRGFSSRNLALLSLQERMLSESHRGLYAGLRQWDRLGRTVKDSARPKCIWAPVPPSKKTTTDPDTGEETVHYVSRRYPFTVVEVFDYSDTFDVDGGPEPDWATPLDYAPAAVRDALIATAPVPVRWEDFTGSGKHGHLSAREIVIATGLAAGSEVETLAHELGHYYLDHLDRIAKNGEAERAGCEQEATLVSYLVLKALGLDESVGNDVTTTTVEYLKSWSADGHKARFEELNERLERAWIAAERILDLLPTSVTDDLAA